MHPHHYFERLTMETEYLKVYDYTHPTHKFGIEVITKENDEYLDTIDVFWFSTEQERNQELRDLLTN